jgi:6-pyruvoyltetrahydropterin/6-carboxytetrahydropterin synthase
MSSKIAVSRVGYFNAAHKLHVNEWTMERNKKVFGLCNNENFHGHNYELHVQVEGHIDPITGYVMDLKELKEIMEGEVISQFDHRNLNMEIAEFKELNPTAENIAVVIWNKIRKKLDPNLDLIVKLYETPRNYVEFRG